MNRMLPNFLIIGAQKSGSTFFLKCLREHPDVFMPQGETRFFEDPEYLQSDIRQLENLFRGVSHQKALGIKRPGYLSRPECAERIYNHIPEAKLMVILRNPVERAISAYFHFMKCGFIPIRPVEEGLTQIVKGEYQKLYPKSAEVIDFGFYHRHLTRYLDYFDKSQIQIMLFDTIQVDSLQAIRQAYRFVGVDDQYVPDLLKTKNRRNPNPGVYSLSRLKILNLRNPFMYTYNQDRTRQYRKLRPSLMAKLIDRMILSTDRLLFTRIYPEGRPKLSFELTHSLFKIYEDDICRMEEFLGHELVNWKSNMLKQGSS